MALTLLQLTQKVCNKLSSDEVDSIFDTTESELYANEILDVFKSIHSRTNENWTKDTFILVDNSKFKLSIPENVQYVDYIKYKGTKLEYITPEEFELKLKTRPKNNGDYDLNGYGLKKDPRYFTTYNEVDIIVDSIIEADGDISAANTDCYGKILPTVELTDTYIPKPLPPALESALLEEATGICLNRYREVQGRYDFQSSQAIHRRMNSRANSSNTKNYLDDFNGWGYK